MFSPTEFPCTAFWKTPQGNIQEVLLLGPCDFAGNPGWFSIAPPNSFVDVSALNCLGRSAKVYGGNVYVSSSEIGGVK